MKIEITKNQDCELYVEGRLWPGTRMASIVCKEYVKGVINQENSVVLMTRGEVEGVINALQKVLDTWDEWNGVS